MPKDRLQIKLVSGVVVEGECRDAGEVLDVPIQTGRLLIAYNQAIVWDDELPAAAALTTNGETIQSRDPQPRARK